MAKKKVIKEEDSVEEVLTSNAPTEEKIKSIFKSKTLWVNVLALVAFFCQRKYGFIIDEATQAEILMIINIILRSLTKEPVRWRK